MILDKDVWRAAMLLVKRYADDAATQATVRANALLAEGDIDGCATWKRIVAAVEALQAGKPGPGEGVH